MVFIDYSESAFASCLADVDYFKLLQESKYVFEGTVTKIENNMGPQLVHFDIIRWVGNNPMNSTYVLENGNKVKLSEDSYSISSTDVGYEVGGRYIVHINYLHYSTQSICTSGLSSEKRFEYIWEAVDRTSISSPFFGGYGDPIGYILVGGAAIAFGIPVVVYVIRRNHKTLG